MTHDRNQKPGQPLPKTPGKNQPGQPNDNDE